MYAANAVIEIGRHLIEAKDRVGEGSFENWMADEFDWSRAPAYRYISVARQFPNVSGRRHQITREAFYLLAGPSAPETSRDEAVERAETGEHITSLLIQPMPALSVKTRRLF